MVNFNVIAHTQFRIMRDRALLSGADGAAASAFQNTVFARNFARASHLWRFYTGIFI
jgi:hypothetical protein